MSTNVAQPERYHSNKTRIKTDRFRMQILRTPQRRRLRAARRAGCASEDAPGARRKTQRLRAGRRAGCAPQDAPVARRKTRRERAARRAGSAPRDAPVARRVRARASSLDRSLVGQVCVASTWLRVDLRDSSGRQARERFLRPVPHRVLTGTRWRTGRIGRRWLKCWVLLPMAARGEGDAPRPRRPGEAAPSATRRLRRPTTSRLRPPPRKRTDGTFPAPLQEFRHPPRLQLDAGAQALSIASHLSCERVALC